MSIKLHTDELTRRLYANDASMYEELPQAVCFPKSAEELQDLVNQANLNEFSITARAAGTSLAGQATGDGIIADVSRYMTRILDIDPETKSARVQPGVIRDELNQAASEYQLLFGPDTSTTNRCMIGGMIGNNSSGSFSIKYQTTRQHVKSMKVVLSDGSTAVFGPLTRDQLKHKRSQSNLEGEIYRRMINLLCNHRDEIMKAYPHPEILRRNTGYALDLLCQMNPITPGGRPFNMCELLCGSEGTLALTAEAELNLEPAEPEKVLLIPQFKNLDEAMEATVEAVKYGPSAVELVDDTILEATEGNTEQRKNRFFLEGKPACLLIIEFQGDDISELREKALSLTSRLQEQNQGYAFPVFEDPEKMNRVWELRKAGLGLLMGLSSDSKSPTFVEDTAVRVEDLPDYIRDFRKILDKYDTHCVFYAHASVGELHLRPVLNLKSETGLEKMKAMADEVADLVKSYRGSLSGEHGDGRARSHNIERVLGSEMVSLLKKVKHIWDPYHRFNPGKIVDPEPMDTDLRFNPEYRSPRVETSFNWRDEGSFAEAVEQCNGAGVCRKKADSGGTMCPSYMATLDEKDSTRGRANVFRQIFSTRQKEAFSSQEIKEALELCLSCKACKSECPANVDMAKLKAEFLNGWHKHNGKTAADLFFGRPDTFLPLASIFAAAGNRIARSEPVRELFSRLFRVDRRRVIPEIAEQPFKRWYRKHRTNSGGQFTAKPRVVLLVDYFTNYNEPEVARSALEVLENLGYSVIAIGPINSGRTQLSRGMVDQAKQTIHRNLERLVPLVEEGLDIIGLEPSEILTYRDEVLDLCEDDWLDKARLLADKAVMFEEFIANQADQHDFPGRRDNGVVHVHGHCHAKAQTGMEPTLHALSWAGYQPVSIPAGCCGMAGSFGYEKQNYEVSMQIGELKLFPAIRTAKAKEPICAHGFSCRHQISDGTGRESLHPAVLVRDAMEASSNRKTTIERTHPGVHA